jgi:DNA (cytosine-5)-methyltransferase 1
VSNSPLRQANYGQVPAVRVAALCAGYDGLGLGLTLAGIDHELVWWSEIDPAASTVMAAHTNAPNLGDLRAITDPPPVDIVTAGFPCQPVSTAGQRAGMDDERWLIRDVVAVWRSSGARWLVLENVPGLLSANGGQAFGAVLDALAEVGAAAEWTHLRASDVGAPHRRERWFCVAHANGPRSAPERPLGRVGTVDVPPDDRRDHPPAHAGGIRCEVQRLSESGIPIDKAQRGRDADRCCGPRFGGYAPAVQRWAQIIERPAPDPTIDGRLSPLFVEWMQGLPVGWVTNCGLSRTQALRVLGNGVVPLQAATAITALTH